MFKSSPQLNGRIDTVGKAGSFPRERIGIADPTGGEVITAGKYSVGLRRTCRAAVGDNKGQCRFFVEKA